MEAWGQLRKKSYDQEGAWQRFLSWVKPSRLSKSRARKLEGEFLVAVVPLMGAVMRTRFRNLQAADRDDICSIVGVRVLEKISRNRATFLEADNAESFTALMTVTLRNLILDYLRQTGREEREFPPEMLYRRPSLSVPKSVDVRLILEELPEHITNFALRRDRFGFGRQAIHFVATQMLAGGKAPEDTLRNWAGVRKPERCISFVTLMARHFLYKYRDKFSPVLEGESSERLDNADMSYHLW